MSAEHIARALRGGEAKTDSIEAVRVLVSRLRRSLEDDVLEISPAGYRLRVQPGERDSDGFAAMVEEAGSALDAHDPLTATSVLCDVLSLWRGPHRSRNSGASSAGSSWPAWRRSCSTAERHAEEGDSQKRRLTMLKSVRRLAVVPALLLSLSFGAEPIAAAEDTPAWSLSRDTLPIGKNAASGVKLDEHRVMWVGGLADDPADSNRSFIYDVRTRKFRETSPVPATKHMDRQIAVGVLNDGSVIVAGGDPASPSSSRLSYRYDPRADTWTRTGDLPEAQGWFFTPTLRLRDGRLLAAGGIGSDAGPAGSASRKAFVFDFTQTARVEMIDATGAPTGGVAKVPGKWDYTRSANTVSTLGDGHLFGSAVLLRDGRVFVGGGHSAWNVLGGGDVSTLATNTDYFSPATGRWTSGAPLPPVAGEDDRIPGSAGGRTNGVCVSVMDDGQVVLAGGATHTDGEEYFATLLTRRSIIVMSPATNPKDSTYRVVPTRIPPGTEFGGLFGDGGRNQLPCYALPQNRVLISGGQSSVGEDLYDTYVFDRRTSTLTRGPDHVHAHPLWAPAFGYPADYEAAVISTLGVSMRNSLLVFGGRTLVHGGGLDGIADEPFPGSRYVEQLTAVSG